MDPEEERIEQAMFEKRIQSPRSGGEDYLLPIEDDKKDREKKK